jgi:Fe-S-cluster-containing hydrogenase component 2
MLPDLAPHIASKVKKMPGVSVVVTDRCVGCSACAKGSCFVDAIRVEEGRAIISGECRGCGRCASICPNHAIEVRLDEPLTRTAEHIASSVDIS